MKAPNQNPYRQWTMKQTICPIPAVPEASVSRPTWRECIQKRTYRNALMHTEGVVKCTNSLLQQLKDEKPDKLNRVLAMRVQCLGNRPNPPIKLVRKTGSEILDAIKKGGPIPDDTWEAVRYLRLT